MFFNAGKEDNQFIDSLIKRQNTKEIQEVRLNFLKDFNMKIELIKEDQKFREYKFYRKECYDKR